jgi:hypothetical protein
VVANVLQKVFDRLHDRVAGLDVHKAQVTAAVRVPAPDGGRLLEVTEFRTTVAGLLALRDWLCAHGVTYVAMEATGVYWKPIWAILEDAFECVLCNPGSTVRGLTRTPVYAFFQGFTTSPGARSCA